MNNTDKTLESLISDGFIDATMGNVLSTDKEEGLLFGLMLGAAIQATIKANKEARKTNIPLYVEEKGKIYALHSSGTKQFIKAIKKTDLKFPEKFKLP